MVLLQGARAGLRHARKAADERNLRVSFTSAGGVRSVTFQLSYDAEQVAVTGVKPGADLPKSARMTLSCVPDGDLMQACIVITSDEEELAGGTLDLASLLVRYLGEVSDDALRLVAVDVRGNDAGSETPVRISIDDLLLSDNDDAKEIVGGLQARIGHLANFGDPVNVDGRVRIAMASLELPAAERDEDEKRPVAASIRIAMPDNSGDEPGLPHPVSEPAHLWQTKPQRRGEAVAGEVRIAAAMLARGGVKHGPRISIP